MQGVLSPRHGPVRRASVCSNIPTDSLRIASNCYHPLLAHTHHALGPNPCHPTPAACMYSALFLLPPTHLHLCRPLYSPPVDVWHDSTLILRIHPVNLRDLTSVIPSPAATFLSPSAIVKALSVLGSWTWSLTVDPWWISTHSNDNSLFCLQAYCPIPHRLMTPWTRRFLEEGHALSLCSTRSHFHRCPSALPMVTRSTCASTRHLHDALLTEFSYWYGSMSPSQGLALDICLQDINTFTGRTSIPYILRDEQRIARIVYRNEIIETFEHNL